MMVSFFYFIISNIKKVINEKLFPRNDHFHLLASKDKIIDLMSNLIEKRYRDMRRAPQCFFLIFPSHPTFEDDSDCLRKISTFSKFGLL